LEGRKYPERDTIGSASFFKFVRYGYLLEIFLAIFPLLKVQCNKGTFIVLLYAGRVEGKKESSSPLLSNNKQQQKERKKKKVVVYI
jgi:hypothetical protein